MSSAAEDFAAGRISAEAALARLALSGLTPDQIAENLEPGTKLAVVFGTHRARLDRLAAMLREALVDHEAPSDPQAIGRMFDRAVRLAPEASVAAYTLGDPALLAVATAEIVDWLLARAYLRPGAAVLDLGCGIGRLAAALAPHAERVLGVDVSPAMVAEARLRHGHRPNARFEATAGGPPDLPPDSLDLVLAVDSFPYLVQAGVAGAHVAAAARMLRSGGVLAILNLSYRSPPEDLATAQDWAARLGFCVIEAGAHPFHAWDGAAYVLKRSPDKGGGPSL